MKIKLSELRKVIKEELQNMTPKLNDDYMLQMLVVPLKQGRTFQVE